MTDTPLSAAHLDALHTSAFGHAGAHGWRKADFDRALTDPAILLAASEDGFAIARRILDEAELLLIATRREARRKGTACSLLAELEDKLRAADVDRLFLEVHEKNAAALAFYDSSGFQRAGARANYYGRGPGHGAVLMLKPLHS